MIDRSTATMGSSSSEFPLFGALSSPQSCGMEAIVIQRPLPTESYSWSDFPIAVQEEDPFQKSYDSSSSPANIRSENSNSFFHPTFQFSKVASDSSFSTSSSSSSIYSSASSATLSSSSLGRIPSFSSKTQRDQLTQDQPQSQSRRNVRFASVPNVRTYSLVLGDHPLCDDGLAIELGWDYNEENEQYNPLLITQSNGDEKEQSGWTAGTTMLTNGISSRASCQRRSYLSRKQLLLDVAGCTKEELEQRTRESKQDRDCPMHF